MRFFRSTKWAVLLFVALLSVAATDAVQACPNSDAEAAEDGGE